MKVKTSVTLSEELIRAIDCRADSVRSRSDFLEQAAWKLLRAIEKRERDEKDIAIYAEFEHEYRQEAEDALALQGDDW